MAYTDEKLRAKILEMYPETVKHGIEIGLDFSRDKNAYIIKFKKGNHEKQIRIRACAGCSD